MDHPLPAIQNASPEQSIWRDLPEKDFRQHLVYLERRTNAVPANSETFALTRPEKAESDNSWPPAHIEQQFADDIAYIASVYEGAQSVAAVCILRRQEPDPLLRLRCAAADTISEPVRTMLSSICRLLHQASTVESPDITVIADRMLSLVLDQHQPKILGRLRSKLWQKPQYLRESHKKPLWQDFANVLHRVQHVYPAKGQKKMRQAVEHYLGSLASLYKQLEQASEMKLKDDLSSLVKATYSVCQDSTVKQFAADLSRLRATSQIAAALKCLHQLEKVGAYWRIAIALVETTKGFTPAFRNIELEYLSPYEPVPTDIAYEPWAKTCHVHAEVQLLVKWDLDQIGNSQDVAGTTAFEIRAIGTSKYLCYLCYLFMKYHGTCFPSNTHGRLYDQWTVPDLAAFSGETRHRYRHIIAKIDAAVCEQAAKEACWRPEPMTSRQNLLLEPHVEQLVEA